MWRLAPDRVLVRRPWPQPGDDEAADLLGAAALVWLALDEPGTCDEIDARLTDAREPGEQGPTDDDLQATIDQLVTAGWLVTVEHRPGSES